MSSVALRRFHNPTEYIAARQSQHPPIYHQIIPDRKDIFDGALSLCPSIMRSRVTNGLIACGEIGDLAPVSCGIRSEGFRVRWSIQPYSLVQAGLRRDTTTRLHILRRWHVAGICQISIGSRVGVELNSTTSYFGEVPAQYSIFSHSQVRY